MCVSRKQQSGQRRRRKGETMIKWVRRCEYRLSTRRCTCLYQSADVFMWVWVHFRQDKTGHTTVNCQPHGFAAMSQSSACPWCVSASVGTQARASRSATYTAHCNYCYTNKHEMSIHRKPDRAQKKWNTLEYHSIHQEPNEGLSICWGFWSDRPVFQLP